MDIKTSASRTTPPPPVSPKPEARLGWQIGVATVSRLTLNTARRFAYPFAPAISQGLGVPAIAVTSLIALNQATGLLGLFFGPFGDRWGYRRMMLAGLAALTVGMLAGGFIPIYGVVIASFLLAGLGKSIYDPAIQAFVGRRVPYARRGWAIGIIELSWAGSTLVGIPAIGLLLNHVGWRAPFFLLGALGAAGAAAVAALLPADAKPEGYVSEPLGLLRSWRALMGERRARGAVAYAFLLSVAYDSFFVVYGIWLEQAFGLGVVAIGMVTIIVGAAELFGEGLTAALADRLGLSRSVLSGITVSILAFLLLPFVGSRLVFGLVFIFFLFLSLEFAIVSSLSLFTEFFPEKRATMMAAFFAGASLGRVLGAMIGVPLHALWGVPGTALLCAVILAGSMGAFGWGIRGWTPGERQEG
jgi:predicted MFS family arabinose efflux permease